MIINNIVVCKKNKNRVNIYGEDGYAFSCYVDTVLTYDLKKEAQLSESQIEEILRNDEIKYALDIALRLLGTRPRSEKEIRRTLAKKEISAESINEAVDDLYKHNLLNDEEFADIFAKELSERYGEKKVAGKIAEKGVSWDIANKAAAKYKNNKSLEYYYERAKLKFGDTNSNEKELKIIRSLMNKGFIYEDIKRVINGIDEK